MANILQAAHNEKSTVSHVNGRIKIHTQSLLNVEPCHFPVLDDGQKSGKSRNWVNVQLPSALAVFDFCDRNNLSISCFFRSVWSLVLRCYVGNDSVSFGYMTLKDHTPKSDQQNTEISSESVMFACCARIHQKDSIRQFLHDMEDAYVPYEHPRIGLRLFNTAVVYQGLDLQQSSEDVESSNAYPCLNEVSNCDYMRSL